MRMGTIYLWQVISNLFWSKNYLFPPCAVRATIWPSVYLGHPLWANKKVSSQVESRRPVCSQGNYLIKHQHIFAYVSAHVAYISVSKSLDQALFSNWPFRQAILTGPELFKFSLNIMIMHAHWFWIPIRAEMVQCPVSILAVNRALIKLLTSQKQLLKAQEALYMAKVWA